MPNMNYCRFQNTLGDLQECLDAIKDGEELSSEEASAAREMLDLCNQFIGEVAACGIQKEQEEEEEEFYCPECGTNYYEDDKGNTCVRDDCDGIIELYQENAA